MKNKTQLFAILLPDGTLWNHGSGSYHSITLFYSEDDAKRACASVKASLTRHNKQSQYHIERGLAKAVATDAKVIPISVDQKLKDPYAQYR
jgi:hypothetical protein